MATEIATVDCEKQVRSWRLLRSLMQLLIPSCNCATTIIEQDQNFNYSTLTTTTTTTTTTVVTGTIFGYRRGKISFCIQSNPNSPNPILLLELAVPTRTLAREMRGGMLRITLESNSGGFNGTLFSMLTWNMYCNGRKVGYAVKRRPSNADLEALRLLSSVGVGTGVMNVKCKDFVNSNREIDDQVMYLRANFQRVRGSSNCESFHLIDPEGDNIEQELSIFFFRSCSSS